MKPTIKIFTLIAVMSGLAASSRADLTNTYENFDSYTVGSFYGSTYNYSGGGGGFDLVASVTNGVVNGATISGNAVEFIATAAASGDNFGVHSVNFDMPLTNNFSPNKADYTVSFDMALGTGSVADFTASFVLYGGDNVSGQEYDISGANMPVSGAGFQHYSFLMSTMGGAYAKTALMMNTITNMSWSLGKYGGATAGTADVLIDNIKITTTASSAPVPVAITTQPTSQTVFAGQSAIFTIQATGYPLPTFQWQTNGVSVAVATNATYIIPNATADLSGIFVTVLVSNTLPSSALSTNNVTLSVVPASGPMVFTSLFASPTANAGYLQGSGTFNVVNGYPVVSANVPAGPYAPTGNNASVDFGTFTNYATQGGGRAITFPNTLNASGTPVGNLGALSGFTVCGWVNCGSSDMGYGGNRIVYCDDGSGVVGFDITTYVDVNGTIGLQLGVNSWGDYPNAGPLSGGYAPVDAAEGAANWTFFAVTYDGTQPTGNVNFYWGDGNTQVAAPYWTTDYNQGIIKNTSTLTVGNANPSNTWWATGSGSAGDVRSWRGLIDEVHVYNRVLSTAEIAAAQVAPASTLVVPPASPTMTAALQSGQIVISWVSSATFQLQSRTNLTSGTTWANVGTAPVVNGTTNTVTVPAANPAQFFRLSQ